MPPTSDVIRDAAQWYTMLDAEYVGTVLSGIDGCKEYGGWKSYNCLPEPAQKAVLDARRVMLGCEHHDFEDHIICQQCGKCRETVDEDDICQDCRNPGVTT